MPSHLLNPPVPIHPRPQPSPTHRRPSRRPGSALRRKLRQQLDPLQQLASLLEPTLRVCGTRRRQFFSYVAGGNQVYSIGQWPWYASVLVRVPSDAHQADRSHKPRGN